MFFEFGAPLHVLDRKTKDFKGARYFTKNGQKLAHGLNSVGFVDREKTIWLGQENGILRARLGAGPDSICWATWKNGKEVWSVGKIENDLFLPDEKDTTRLRSGSIGAIFEDSKNRLWIGTAAGLHLAKDRKRGVFRRFGKRNGFDDLNIASIEEDLNGQLWIRTGNGLAVFDPETERVSRIYSHNDGLPHSQFSSGAAFRKAKGDLFFGTLKGLAILQPKATGGNRFLAEPTVFQVFADEKPMSIDLLKNEVAIPPSTKNLRIDFAELDFTAPKNSRYRYKLVGFENQFSGWSEKRSANFSELSPKKYVFEIAAAKAANLSDARTAQLTICAKPEWWQTWAATLAFFWLGLGGLYFFIKNREKKIKADRDKVLRLKSLQVQTHQAQMNPHFIFNVLTAIKSLVVNKKPDEAGAYLDKFATLIRRYLDSSVKSGMQQGSQQSVVQNEISLAQEIELIDMYVEFELLKYENRFEYERPKPDFVVENVSVPPMLIQPFVENAIKHGLLNLPLDQKGHLKVTFELDETDALTCTVLDNGVGLKKAAELQRQSIKHFQSLGKALTEQRVEILNELGYDIKIRTRERPEGGTEVIVRIA